MVGEHALVIGRLPVDPMAGVLKFGRRPGRQKRDGDGRFADVVDGKRDLFVNAAIFEKYSGNRDEVLRVASDKGPGIRTTPISDLRARQANTAPGPARQDRDSEPTNSSIL